MATPKIQRTAPWPIPAPYNQHSGISPAHSEEWFVDHLIKNFPPSLALLLPLWKADDFLLHLFCLYVFQRVIPNQSSSLYTVSSKTSDLSQLAGCHPKFYMEMCESILLAPEVQHAPTSFKKNQACWTTHFRTWQTWFGNWRCTWHTFSYEIEKLIVSPDIFRSWCSSVH